VGKIKTQGKNEPIRAKMEEKKIRKELVHHNSQKFPPGGAKGSEYGKEGEQRKVYRPKMKGEHTE